MRAEDISPEAAFARALSGFFVNKATVYDFESLCAHSPGNYIMYRPFWRSAPEDRLLQTSLIQIYNVPHGLKIVETQDFPPGEWDYFQRDEGFLFPFCNHIYY